jgi:hypothetical protein
MKRATEKGAHFAPFAGRNYDTDDKSIAITPDVYVMKESDESSLLSSEPHSHRILPQLRGRASECRDGLLFYPAALLAAREGLIIVSESSALRARRARSPTLWRAKTSPKLRSRVRPL